MHEYNLKFRTDIVMSDTAPFYFVLRGIMSLHFTSGKPILTVDLNPRRDIDACEELGFHFMEMKQMLQ